MIDTTTEHLIAFSQVQRHPLLKQGRRNGRPVHRATIDRWRVRGVGGTRLETIRIGGTRYTSEEALQRFIGAINGEKVERGFRTPAARERQIRKAEAETAEAGIQ